VFALNISGLIKLNFTLCMIKFMLMPEDVQLIHVF